MTTKKPIFVQVQPDTIVRPGFKFKELGCPCCGLVVYHDEALAALAYFRHGVQQPVIVTSGSRCAAHNREVGGSPTSKHLRGMAFDIVVSRDQMGKWAQLALEDGFREVIPYPDDGHLHIGV